MTEYSVFTTPDFDANEYANAILAGDPYPPAHQQPTSKSKAAVKPSGEDIGVAISKLNFGIEDVGKQIKSVVNAHHEELLEQAASAADLSGSLTAVRQGLDDLDSSLVKLRTKIHLPYESLHSHVARLQQLSHASDVLRRMSRFVILARRLEGQMAEMGSSINPNGLAVSGQSSAGEDNEDEKERTIAKAALSIAELVALLDGPTDAAGRTAAALSTAKDTATSSASEAEIPLRVLNTVCVHVPFIEDARVRVTAEMENMVLTGLSNLNQSLLASSLQTAFNLRVLPALVQSLVVDLSAAVEERIRTAFDLSKISKDVLAKDPAPHPNSPYKSRIRTEPTNVTAPQWTAALWTRLESLVEEMADCCIKVYTLEKVLKLKKDAVTGTVFLDEAMKLLENKPSTTFWTSLGRSLEKHLKDTARNSSFLQQTLSTGYPRLLRLFHQFFAKIAVHTDTVYTQAQQSPETILVLRALSTFESLYLSRSINRLNEVVALSLSGGTRSPPGLNEGVTIARTVGNELDSARFDVLLVRSVSKGVGGCLEGMVGRVDGLIARERGAVTLLGPGVSSQQAINSSIATCLYHCWTRLEQLEEEYSEPVYSVLQPIIKNMHHTYESIVDPLLTAIRRELSAIIARLHRIDFGKSGDPMSGMGGGSSLYMKDLVEKLGFIKNEIFGRFNVGEDSRTWVISIVKFVIRTFVLHVSIAKPLGECGKLQLTSDMTELEFALSAFMVENPQSKRGGNLEVAGDDYRALRAMRPLLFLDNAQLASPKHTIGLPPLIVLHHILVRSPVPLPHSLHGWQEAEYVRWVDEHSEVEARTLVEGGLSHWEKISEAEEKDPSTAMEYIQMARMVLANARAIS